MIGPVFATHALGNSRLILTIAVLDGRLVWWKMFNARLEQGGNFGKIEILRLSKDDIAAYATAAKPPVQSAALILLALSDVDC